METTMETETTITRRKKAGWVNVVYFCEEDNTVWAPGEIWAKGLVNGKGNVNSSEITTVPEGYKLRVVGDYYYNGGDELRVEVIKEKTQGGRVNVVYYCEEDNTVWPPERSGQGPCEWEKEM